MFRKSDVRDLFESHCNGDAAQFTREVCHLMGLTDREGNRYRDEFGRPRFGDVLESDGTTAGPRLKPNSFSLKHLGLGLLGEDLFEDCFSPDRRGRGLVRAQRHMTDDLLEAGEGAVSPGAYANVNAFTAVVSGLLEISIMEGWKNPNFVMDEIMPPEATKMFDGRKKIGSSRIGDLAEERLPGMPTKRVQVGERWITQPRTVENSFAAEVLQETVFLDLTGEAVREATDLGTWLHWRKEIRQIDALIGVTNTYSFIGTSYNTFQSNGTWNNDLSNELIHETALETVLLTFRDMQDPQTNTRVLIQPDFALVNLGKWRTAREVFGDLAVGVQYRDAPGSTTNAQLIRVGDPAYKGMLSIITSPLVYQRCTDTSGLGLTNANAEKYWWVGQRGCIVYAENWPLRTQQAVPNTSDMIDRGVVLYTKADERGIPFWQEPRKIIRNKN
jgi:hypothetical protein